MLFHYLSTSGSPRMVSWLTQKSMIWSATTTNRKGNLPFETHGDFDPKRRNGW
jgi:hypothetical protein